MIESARPLITHLRHCGLGRVLFVGGAGSFELAQGQQFVGQPPPD